VAISPTGAVLRAGIQRGHLLTAEVLLLLLLQASGMADKFTRCSLLLLLLILMIMVKKTAESEIFHHRRD